MRKLVPRQQRADTFVGYLVNQVWKALSSELYPSTPPLGSQAFTMEELSDVVLRALTKRRAPGRDTTSVELP